jgi:1-acyl-sn-glycerol-3-phosphate acyltransferase
MSASPAAAIARALRYLVRLPMLAWHLLVHLPLVLATVALGDAAGRPRWGHLAIRWWSRGLLRVFGLRVRGEGTPLPGGTLFVANHVSWVDIVALHSQHMMGFIAKSEIRRWPVVGWITTHAETVFLQRGNAHSLDAVMGVMMQRLRAGRAVAAFPEGGTRDGSALGTFHARIFTAAVAADAPVQPVALCYGERCEAQAIVAFGTRERFLHNFWRLLGEPVRPARVCFLEPILHANHAGRRGIAQTAQARIAAAMARA